MNLQAEVGLSWRNNIHIKSFPNDGKLWMVGWLGSVIYSYRHRSSAHPAIHVHLFSVVDENLALNYGNFNSAEDGVARTVLISPGQLMLIRIGDIWRDGRLVRAASGTRIELKDFLVNENSSKIVSAGSDFGPYNDWKYIPFNGFKFHRASTKSQCVALTLKDGRIILIPCFELIRMYFGSSSGLLDKLFENGDDWRRFYKWAKLKDNGHLSVQMAPGIPIQSVEDVARIAGSKKASFAAQMVVRSCIAASVSSLDIYPKCFFPFDGYTDLTVVGRNIYSGVYLRPPVFLVQFIEKCTHPFPFKSCWAISDNSSRAGYIKSVDRNSTGSKGVSGSKSGTNPSPSIVDADPSNKLDAINFAVGRDRYFPDLDGKIIHRSSGLHAFGSGRGVSSASESQSVVAVGDPVSSGDIRPVNIVGDQLAEVVPPDFLLKILKIIDELGGCEYQFLAVEGADGCTVPLSWLADEDGVIDPRLLKEGESSRAIKVAMMALGGVGDGHVLVVIEADMAPLIYMNQRNGPDDLERLCRCIIEDYLFLSDLPKGSFPEFRHFSVDKLSPAMSAWVSRFYVAINAWQYAIF